MKRNKSVTISHEEALIKELKKNPKFAVEYLKAAMGDQEDPRVLLLALRQVAEATGHLSSIAEEAGIKQSSLYRDLSEKGNPRYLTLNAILKAIGLKLTVIPA